MSGVVKVGIGFVKIGINVGCDVFDSMEFVSCMSVVMDGWVLGVLDGVGGVVEILKKILY